MSPLQSIKEAAGALAADERAELAEYLLNSLGSDDELAAVQAEWMEVAHRRLEEIRSGRVVGVPAKDVLENLRKRQR
jgi:putative addiction module component (TIGR02574 family)